MRSRNCSDGEIVYRTGDAGEAAYRVRAGHVTVSRPGADGGEKKARLGPGEMFGHAALLSGGAHDETARAAGEVVLEVIGRTDIGDALARRPDAAALLLAAAFGDGSGDGGSGAARRWRRGKRPATVRLRALEPDIAGQFDDGGLVIDRLPFLVGRAGAGSGKQTPSGIDLALNDRRPYNLSRRHFAVETDSAGLLVRDCGSYHGTTVNGVTVGGNHAALTAPLRPGENEVIAGSPDSPFRFTLTVGSG